MKLLTKEIKTKLPPLYENEDKPLEEQNIIVKFFTPDAQATWYISEGQYDGDGDWLFFGLCDLGIGYPELGYIRLKELEALRGHLGLPVERDMYYGYDHTLSEVISQ